MPAPIRPTNAAAIASYVNGVLRGDGDVSIKGICAFDRPSPGALCFVSNLVALEGVDPTAEGAILIAPSGAGQLIRGCAILAEHPRLAYAKAVSAFFVTASPLGIAASAHVDPSAQLGDRVVVGEGCVIGPDVHIGKDTELRRNVIIATGVRIGERCLIKSGSVIGEDGFGMARNDDGSWLRIPHFGSVVIGDDVELGALNTVAAGTIEPTRVGDGVKTDDHVHIAHNCSIGPNAVLTACAELSGSVTVGRGVWIGPNVSVIDGITIAAGSLIGIGAVVTRPVEISGTYAGSPARFLEPRS